MDLLRNTIKTSEEEKQVPKNVIDAIEVYNKRHTDMLKGKH